MATLRVDTSQFPALSDQILSPDETTSPDMVYFSAAKPNRILYLEGKRTRG